MTVYVAMLRGVNVGGNSLKMDWLRAACEDLGLQNVRTYVQSGNIVFSSRASAAEARVRRSRTTIDAQTRLPVTVVMRSAADMATDRRRQPVSEAEGHRRDKAACHVSWTRRRSSRRSTGSTRSPAPATNIGWRVRELYLHCPINYGETKLSNGAIEKVLGVGATTRNWKTVTTLHQMAAE